MVSPVVQVIDLDKAYPGLRSTKLNSLSTRRNVGQLWGHITQFAGTHWFKSSLLTSSFAVITVSWVTGTNQSDYRTQGMKTLYTTHHLCLLCSLALFDSVDFRQNYCSFTSLLFV